MDQMNWNAAAVTRQQAASTIPEKSRHEKEEARDEARTRSGKELLRDSGMFGRSPHLNDASLTLEGLRLPESEYGYEKTVSMLGISLFLSMGVLNILDFKKIFIA